MAEQLTFFGTWEAVLPPAPAPPESTVLPPAQPADPRQGWLFDGPLSLRHEAERACDQLDAEALRRAWHEAQAHHPAWPGARPWPAWAEGIEHLLGGGERISAAEQAARALALDGAPAPRRFPGMSPIRLQHIRAAALCRAAARLIEEEGLGARLADGRPAGYLPLAAGVPEEAVIMLRLQAQASCERGRGLLLGYLGEALWRCGRTGEAVAAYRDAYLEAPEAVDEQEMTCRPVMDLLDACADLELPGEGRAWLPVLADLTAGVPLPGECAPAPPSASAARLGAALLAAYRQRQAAGMDEAERVRRKREILRLAPGLKDHLRRI